MQSKSAVLQDQINELDLLIQQGASDAQLNLWEMQRQDLKDQLQAALESEQAHEGRIQEATTESSSFLGDIDIAGVPIAESGLSELAFSILNSKVQAKHIAAIEKLSLAMNEQQAQHQQELKVVTDRAIQAETNSISFQAQNKELEVANYQLGLDNDEMDKQVRKGAGLLFEATETIKKQNELIEGYKKAELLAPQPAVVLSTSEQVAKQEAQLKASQIPVTYMKVDPDDLLGKIWNIITVVPEESRSIHYFEKGLYRLVSAEEAEQYRADEANKKAEIEAQQASIPTLAAPDIEPVNPVLEEEAPAEENSFQEEVAAANDSGLQEDQGNSIMESVVSEESEVDLDIEVVFTLEYVRQLRILEEKVANIESKLVA